MTTELEYSQQPSFSRIDIAPISSDPDEDWQHLVLEMFRPESPVLPVQKPRLYLIPSTFGEEYDAEFAPKPTSASDLPDIRELIFQFIHSVVEIWAGRRTASQVQAMCHHLIFADLQRKAGQLKLVGKIRKIKVTEPLDGISETTVTIRYGDRLRVVAIRFEGLDGRWLCTALTLI
jgi:Family of unknown function (DUF6459)